MDAIPVPIARNTRAGRFSNCGTANATALKECVAVREIDVVPVDTAPSIFRGSRLNDATPAAVALRVT